MEKELLEQQARLIETMESERLRENPKDLVASARLQVARDILQSLQFEPELSKIRTKVAMLILDPDYVAHNAYQVEDERHSKPTVIPGLSPKDQEDKGGKGPYVKFSKG